MNCDVSGGRTYQISNGINAGGNSTDWVFQTVTIHKMKFVDAGNQLWSDPNNWQVWNGTSWGANTLNCVPTPFVDIYVDASSFPFANKWIEVDTIARCRDIFWSSTTVGGATMHINRSFYIFGSASFDVNMGALSAPAAMYFYGHNDTLTTNGLFIPKVIFWKHSNYYLNDNLSANEVHGWLFSTIRADNIIIDTRILSLSNRDLHNTRVNLTGNFYDFGATLVDYTGSTTFYWTPTAGIVDIRRQKDYA